jgi:hypothetical protein
MYDKELKRSHQACKDLYISIKYVGNKYFIYDIESYTMDY